MEHFSHKQPPPPYSPTPNAPAEEDYTPIVPPITDQPQAVGGLPSNAIPLTPQHPPPCPPGLEYLTMLDQLLVNQTVEMLEVFTGFETTNKYVIKNSIGQMVYYAREESDCCVRNCCGPRRKLELRIVDNVSRQVIHIKRRFACQSCLCPCWLQKIEVSSPPGVAIGYVEQNWNPVFPSFTVKDSSDEPVLTIKGPFWTSSCCCRDVKFRIMSANGSVKVGKIYKQWSGMAKETFTDADNFAITFPMDLDVRIKAVILAATFLIDYMYFESTDSKNRVKVQNASGVPSVNYEYKCCCCCPSIYCGSFTMKNGLSTCCCC